VRNALHNTYTASKQTEIHIMAQKLPTVTSAGAYFVDAKHMAIEQSMDVGYACIVQGQFGNYWVHAAESADQINLHNHSRAYEYIDGTES
jgi:hypothetical protein